MKLKNMLSRNMTWKNPRRSRGSMSQGTGSKLIVGITDHSDKKIKVFIRAELDELNWSA
jgi:hypothetical protein